MSQFNDLVYIARLKKDKFQVHCAATSMKHRFVDSESLYIQDLRNC